MMEPTIGLIGIVVLIALLALRVQVGGALAFVGFVGLIFFLGLQIALLNMALIPFHTLYSYSFATLPLFTLMGLLVSEGGIARDAYATARHWVGNMKGGLAIATIMGCGLFASVCGSSTASAVSMAKIAMPEMQKYGYDRKLAVGSIAAGGTIGILIPPSAAFVLLGILTEISIGKLFIAGIFPGLIEVILYIIVVYILCRVNPSLGPAAGPSTLKVKMKSLQNVWKIVLLFAFVMGGIYTGKFSATEAGSLGAFAALIIGLTTRKLSRDGFTNAVMETARTTALIMTMLVGAYIFMRFLALSKIPFVAGEWIVSSGMTPLTFTLVIAVCFYITGMFFDMWTMVVLTTPILFPMAMAMNIDPIWWCVFMVMEIEAGSATPPFGINIFALSASTQTDMGTVYRGVLPFTAADIVRLAILIIFPVTATWLPSQMMI